MGDSVLIGLLLTSLVATAVLYWLRVNEQVRARRIEDRLTEIRHVAAVVRTTLAEARRPHLTRG